MKKIYPIRLEEETIDDLQTEAKLLKMRPTTLARNILEEQLQKIKEVASHIRGDAPGLKNR